MTCGNCQHYRVNDSVCMFSPPAIIAKALGFSDQYKLPFAYTHPEWGCDLHKEGEPVRLPQPG